SVTGRWSPRRAACHPTSTPAAATSELPRGRFWKPSGSSPRRRACPICCSACVRWSARWRRSAAVSSARASAVSDAIHPSAIIDPRARLDAGVRVGAFSVIGPEVTLESGVEIGHHAVLEGRVALGPRVKVGHGSVVGGAPQDLKYKDGTPSGVRVGADTVIREYAPVHRPTYVGGMAKLTADVPPFVLVDGQPATARAINVIGLRRAGMNPTDRRALQDAFRILYRSGLAPARAVERIREEMPATEPVRLMLDF